jgi:pseudaminic acid cytidylyltransferase
MKKCLAIIPARGGSKRIPRKNLRDFLEKPIIEYSISAALRSSCFTEVMVSTDDNEIATLALRAGAKVPFMRSAKNSDDNSVTASVVREVLDAYAEKGMEFEYCCCIYPTAPFITPEKLNKAFELLNKSGAKSVVTVVPFSFSIFRSFKIEQGLLRMNWPEYMNTRSQDLDPAFHDCGQFYFLRVATFLKEGILFTDNTIPLELNELEVQDIDTLIDWKIAEIKYQLKNNK